MPFEKAVVFRLNNEEFAIDIQQVERILGFIEPTKVPESPYFIKGIIKYQNNILPIMDLNAKFNKQNNDNINSKIIVVKHNEKSIGLLVDDVQEVIDVKKDEIESTPEVISQYSNKYINGILKKENRIIMIIDTEKILTKEEFSSLSTL